MSAHEVTRSSFRQACTLAKGDIRDGAILSRSYVIMNALAAVIACYGLLENSPAVVIGAMVVAMLLGPILGIALGIVDGDRTVLRKALASELFGIGLVYAVAMILGFIHHDLPITQEIMARTAPNFMDLMIALAGGAAGAYALIAPHLGLSLVGVAVATALVPPLCASALLLARGDFVQAGNAFLLAFTNVVAIHFSASGVFLIFKCDRESLKPRAIWAAAKRDLLGTAILLVLAVILVGNVRNVIAEQTFRTRTTGILRQQIALSRGAYLEDVRFESTPKSRIVRAVVRGPREFTRQEVASVARNLPPDPKGTTVDFRLRFVRTVTITPTGILYDDPDGTERQPGETGLFR
jgi:uncharacterized hydrophobic protein (TIGR00271 family)